MLRQRRGLIIVVAPETVIKSYVLGIDVKYVFNFFIITRFKVFTVQHVM